ncbi:MAG: hypothetical protein ACLP19_00190 [Xanthobacteraceae bacterium]
MGFFFVAAKCLCASGSNFVEACCASATARSNCANAAENEIAFEASKTLPRRAIDIASGIIDNGSASLQARAQSFQIESIVALSFWWSMIFSENRVPLFRIKL